MKCRNSWCHDSALELGYCEECMKDWEDNI